MLPSNFLISPSMKSTRLDTFSWASNVKEDEERGEGSVSVGGNRKQTHGESKTDKTHSCMKAR